MERSEAQIESRLSKAAHVLAELIGIRSECIQWQRAAIFAVVLLLTDAATILLKPALRAAQPQAILFVPALAGTVLAFGALSAFRFPHGQAATLALAGAAYIGGATAMMAFQEVFNLATMFGVRPSFMYALHPFVLFDLRSAVGFVALFYLGLGRSGTSQGMISKGVYIGLVVGVEAIGEAARQFGEFLMPFSVAGLIWNSAVAFAQSVFFLVVLMVFCHRLWARIQDGYARTSPAQAVGLLFFPLFNIAWCFQVIWGFAKDYNMHVIRHSLNLPKLPASLFLVFSMLLLLSYAAIGPLILIIQWILLVIIIWKASNAANALPHISSASQAGGAV